MTRRGTRVAILGAGIMGSSLALFLARRGIGVALFDQADAPVAGASRWNEGKIHLGYLYGADPTLRTARHVVPGGLHFGRLVSELVGCDLAPHTTADDDVYVVHRRSVVDTAPLRAQFDAVSAVIREQRDARRYLVDVSTAHASPLSPTELRALANPEEVVAGFRVPERSVNTGWVADRLGDALAGEPRVSVRTGTTITRVEPGRLPRRSLACPGRARPRRAVRRRGQRALERSTADRSHCRPDAGLHVVQPLPALPVRPHAARSWASRARSSPSGRSVTSRTTTAGSSTCRGTPSGSAPRATRLILPAPAPMSEAGAGGVHPGRARRARSASFQRSGASSTPRSG